MTFSRLTPIAAVLLLTATGAIASVQVSETTISLPTWSEGPPDPNPLFDWFSNSGTYNGIYAAYPYTYRVNFLSDSPNQTWRMVVLENEYLACRLFPDLGGHLYSCLDKIGGREMFYSNPVIRKANVGLRGAWAALGIELNFPVGHSLVSVSPISYGTSQNSDGSASMWVADIDRKTGLEMRVEYRLQPLSTVLIQNVNLYNRGEARQPYYFWSNGEVKIEDQNSEFLYPTNIVATHGFTFLDTWPVSTTGVGESVVKNITAQEGLFAYGTNEPFMAIYHPATRAATVHYADPTAMPGKKLWAWGSGAYGDSWVLANLTFNFASYLETQAGVTPNQETHDFLDPQQSSHFTEYWMPARGLDGVTRANLNGVLYFGRNPQTGALWAELNVNQAFPNATVQVLSGSNVVYSETASLTPAVTYTHTLPSPSTSATYTFQLTSGSGSVLLSQTEGQYNDLPASSVTLGAQPQVNLSLSDTDQEVLARADYHERLQQFVFAESDYQLGLTKFPQSLPLLKASGRLAAAAGRFAAAQSQLTQYLASTPNDDEARYYLGLAYFGSGQSGAAINAFASIQNTADFGRPATFELACLRALTGDLGTAASLFDSVNAATPDAVRAAGLEIAVLRHLGQTAAATAKLAQWRAIAPTDPFLRYEQTLSGSADATLATALGAEPERVLNLADDYFRVGLPSDAAALLATAFPDVPALQREPGSTLPQNSALAVYHRGYANQLMGGSGASDFATASSMPLSYVFPNRPSSLAALRAAIQNNSSDATAHYLLGLLYMSQRLPGDAIAEWQMARSIRKDLPALHRNLGRALLDAEYDPVSALGVLTEGLSYNPSNPDLQDAYHRALAAAPAGSSCGYTLTGATAFGGGASTGTVTASPPGSCALSPVSYSTWLTINSALNGVVSYSLAANPAPTARTAALSVGGQLFAITQAGLACTFSLAAASGEVPSSGGPLIVNVTAPGGCTWSVASSPSWTSPVARAGSGSSSASLTVSANSGAPRSYAANIAGQTFNVVQDSSTGFFVTQLYLDLLNRAPDSGLAYWSGILNSGSASRAQVAAQFFTSNEFSSAGLYIIKLYEAVLHRDPDFAGWQYWFTSLQSGVPSNAVLNAFLASNEFQTAYGNLSNSAFVTLVYQNVLGRAPDPGGLAYWVGQLNGGAITRAAVMNQFILSVEFDTLIRPRAYANLLYMGFLRRTADPAGLQYWTQSLASGNPLANVVGAFIGSAEYWNRFLQQVP